MDHSETSSYTPMPDWLRAKDLDWSALDRHQPGRQLAEIRAALDIDLAYIAETTAIHIGKLEALERDDYELIGASTFVTGYLRKYAKLLGLEPEHFVRAYQSRPERDGADSDPTADKPASGNHQAKRLSRSISGGFLVLRRLPMWSFVVVALLLWIMVIMLMPSPDSQLEADLSDVPPPPAADSAPDPALMQEMTEPTPAGPDIRAEPPEDSAQTADVEDTRLEPPYALLDISPSAPTADALTGQSPGGPTRTEDDVLTLSFTDDCWVEVSEETGKLLFARLQRSGDNLRLTGSGPFSVKLGNARAATMEINGRDVPIEPAPGRKTIKLLVN